MTPLVAAVLTFCFASAPDRCESHQFRIERSACGLKKQAEMPINGEWQRAEVAIKCATTGR